MKRREFICGLSCLIAGFGIGQVVPFKFFKYTDKEDGIERVGLGGFTVAVSSHCNLNCKGCDTYSPLAKEEFVSFEDFSRDLDKLKELAPDREMNIAFMGGEPLLNPDITKLIRKTKEVYPEPRSVILTNGILLSQMSDDFWKTIMECEVDLRITTYPINIDRSSYEKKEKEFNINIGKDILKADKLYDFNKKEVIDDNYKEYSEGFEWSKNVLDLNGKQDYVEKRKSCPHRGIVQYARGNIYYCYVHAFINAFIDYFKVDIPITKDDYIRIADVKDIKEIDDFLSKPKPLCRFCKQCHNTCYGGEPLEWGFSERKISEWT